MLGNSKGKFIDWRYEAIRKTCWLGWETERNEHFWVVGHGILFNSHFWQSKTSRPLEVHLFIPIDHLLKQALVITRFDCPNRRSHANHHCQGRALSWYQGFVLPWVNNQGAISKASWREMTSSKTLRCRLFRTIPHWHGRAGTKELDLAEKALLLWAEGYFCSYHILKLFIHIHSALRILHNTLPLEYVGEACFRLLLTFVNYPKQRQVDVQLRPLSREESLRRSASAVSFFKVAQGMCRHVAEIL